MSNREQGKELSLKRCFLEGVLLDFFLLFGASLFMDRGRLAMITLIIVIVHLAASAVLALIRRWQLSISDSYFVRFGTLYIIVISMIGGLLFSVIVG